MGWKKKKGGKRGKITGGSSGGPAPGPRRAVPAAPHRAEQGAGRVAASPERLQRAPRPAAGADGLPRPRVPPRTRARRQLRFGGGEAGAFPGRLLTRRVLPLPRATRPQSKPNKVNEEKNLKGRGDSLPLRCIWQLPQKGLAAPSSPPRGSGGWRRRRARSSAVPSSPASLTGQRFYSGSWG